MVNLLRLTIALAVWSILDLVLAHPSEVHDAAYHKRELKIRDHLTMHSKRALESCESSLKAHDLKVRAISRRATTAKSLRQNRGLPAGKAYKRDLAALQTWEHKSHEQNGTGYTLTTPESTMFGANTSCVLTPEDTLGPYYVSGELIRSNITETQFGIPMHLEIQFVNTQTCEPISGLLADIWACNATGIYSGVEASLGEAGLESTFLRGLQISDSDGVVEFDTIVPGHYTGRATHQHVITHINATKLPNGTYTGGTINHVGQLFFDEAFRSEVEAPNPYNTNKQVYVSNDDDMWAPTAASADYDPFPEYVMLGDSLSDGVLFWISIGINTTANYTEITDLDIASFWTEDGGVNNDDDQFYLQLPGHGKPNGTANTTSGSIGSAPTQVAVSAASAAVSAAQVQVLGLITLVVGCLFSELYLS